MDRISTRVLIVGAGLSGIGAAYHLQTLAPGKTYAVLEARDAIGGTWDLFRYPGIRSDSDMYTLAYPFEPWQHERAIAAGALLIRRRRPTPPPEHEDLQTGTLTGPVHTKEKTT